MMPIREPGSNATARLRRGHAHYQAGTAPLTAGGAAARWTQPVAQRSDDFHDPPGHEGHLRQRRTPRLGQLDPTTCARAEQHGRSEPGAEHCTSSRGDGRAFSPSPSTAFARLRDSTCSYLRVCRYSLTRANRPSAGPVNPRRAANAIAVSRPSRRARVRAGFGASAAWPLVYCAAAAVPAGALSLHGNEGGPVSKPAASRSRPCTCTPPRSSYLRTSETIFILRR
jgi:hypothetical protein